MMVAPTISVCTNLEKEAPEGRNGVGTILSDQEFNERLIVTRMDRVLLSAPSTVTANIHLLCFVAFSS